MPQLIGSTTPIIALAAIAASAALPPALSTSSPACDASGWLVATMPFLAITTERLWPAICPPRSNPAAILRGICALASKAMVMAATTDARKNHSERDCEPGRSMICLSHAGWTGAEANRSAAAD